MPTIELSYAANGTNWGSAYYDSGGPTYAKFTASTGTGATSSFFGGTAKWRACWEIDMAALVALGYKPGREITAASLTMAVTARSGGAVKPGLLSTDFSAAAATLFAAIAPANCQGASDAFSGTGSKTLILDATLRGILAATGPSAKLMLAVPLANEAGGGQMATNPASPCTLSLTFKAGAVLYEEEDD